MNRDVVDSILASFSGYSPALPPLINSFLLELARGATDPQRPLLGAERDTLERNFEVSLTVLHQFVQNSPHDRAVAWVERIRAEGIPFALYLRSFDLGARPAGPPEDVPSGVDAGMSEQFFLVRMEDHNFQRLMQEQLGPLIPVLGIENDMFEFHLENDLPRLRLSSVLWPYVVRKLVESAAIIVLFVHDMTPGIAMELSMLRSAEQQSKTIVISLNPRGSEEFEDFPMFVLLDGHEKSQELSDAVARMRPFANRSVLDLDSQLLPPRPVLPHVHAGAEALLDLAMSEAGREIQQHGPTAVAHDALIAAIAASMWSRNTLARAVVYKRLAMLQFEQDKLMFARSNLVRFLDVVELQTGGGRSLAPVLAGLEPVVRELENGDPDDLGVVRFRRLEKTVNS